MSIDPSQRMPRAPTEDEDGSVVDRSTMLSEQRTALSIERSFLAFERTLMAWLRTSLSMIGFGFTLAKFFAYLEEHKGGAVVGRLGRTWASDTVGLAMIAIGTVALVIAVVQHKLPVEIGVEDDKGLGGLNVLDALELLGQELVQLFHARNHDLDEKAAVAESHRCLQCDLRLKIKAVEFWGSF